jgi:hypothetical protein
MKSEKVQTERLDMRVERRFLASIDDWRARQRPILTRSEAIRALVFRALASDRPRDQISDRTRTRIAL